VSTQVSSACGCPFGIRVTTVARFLPLASRITSSSSGIADLHTPAVLGLADSSPASGLPRDSGPKSPRTCIFWISAAAFGVSLMIEYTFAL
jgi:hypothetical protein